MDSEDTKAVCCHGDEKISETNYKDGPTQPTNHDAGLDTCDLSTCPVPPDGGWGWVVCGGAFFCMVILDGIMFSFGVLFLELLDYFQEGKGRTAMVGSALMGGHLLVGPITSAMVNAWGIRAVTMTGAVIATVAMALSTLAPNITVLTALYGIVGGVGVSMVYLPAILAVGFYFEKRRALANGITMSGSGIGTFVYSPLTSYLQDEFGWKGAMLILAGLVLNCVVCGALFRPLIFRTTAHARDANQSKSAEEEESLLKTRLDRNNCVRHSFDQCTSNKNVHNTESYSLSSSAQGLSNTQQHRHESQPTNHSSSHEFSANQDILPQISNKNICNHDCLLANGYTSDKMTRSLTVIPSVGISASSAFKDKRLLALQRELTPHNKPLTISISCDGLVLNTGSVRHLANSQELKPMYRKDVFYSGSVNRLHECNAKSVASVYSLPRSVASVTPPGDGVETKVYKCLRSWCRTDDIREMLQRMCGISLLANPVFLLSMLSMVLWTTHSTILTILPDYAVLNDIPNHQAALLLSIIGVTNTIARVLSGWLADKPQVDVLWVNVGALLLGGATCLAISFTHAYWLLALEAALFGLGMGTWTALRPIILVSLLGLDNLTNAFGMTAMFQGVAFMVGPPIAGCLYDVTHSYHYPFLIAAAAFTTSGLLCLPMRRIARCMPGTKSRDLPEVVIESEHNDFVTSSNKQLKSL